MRDGRADHRTALRAVPSAEAPGSIQSEPDLLRGRAFANYLNTMPLEAASLRTSKAAVEERGRHSSAVQKTRLQAGLRHLARLETGALVKENGNATSVEPHLPSAGRPAVSHWSGKEFIAVFSLILGYYFGRNQASR
jgi:hypothetical protein